MSIFSTIQDVADVEYAFFDVFDTIITRTVHPEYVKRLAAKGLCIGAGLNIHPDEAYKARVEVELRLRKESERKGHDPEYGFHEFSRAFFEELKKRDPKGAGVLDPEEFEKLCCHIELETEKGVQMIDPAGIEAVAGLKRRGIPVSCISDFYLPAPMMEDLFRHHGIEGAFENIFVSCDYLAAKWTGRLYDHALKAIGRQPGKVLMVGDNEHADYRPALAKGLRACLLDRGRQRAFYSLFMKSALDVSKTARRVDAEYWRSERRLEKRLFSETVFPLFLFTQKLHARLKKNRVKDVFFLSKEGEFLKRLFDLYQDSLGLPERTRVRTHYLIASRRSTFLPSLGPLSGEDFHTLFRQYTDISPDEFFLSLNFTKDEMEQVKREAGVRGGERITGFHASREFDDIKASRAFSSTYEKKRSAQREAFGRYLGSFGVDLAGSGLHIVDVGWKGTIQDNISRYLGGKVTVTGYYLGLTGDAGTDENSRKEGILFSLLGDRTRFYRTYNENKQLFEMILGASHGSAKRYEEKGGKAVAVVEDIEEERALFVNHIGPTQRAIEERFRILCGLFREVHFYPADLEEYFAKKLARLMFLPTNEEMDFFQGLYHYQNFGYFEFTRFDAPRLGLAGRMRNLMALCKDPYWTLARGWWGSLTLRKMGLSPLRYPYAMFRFCQLYFRKK